ncbi:hypothetical protein KAR91_55555 [Candidatus Pacearchaeota archaeon]|nr:hypothetical protein [Candidatus Pacearchaeota archaeon]
MKISINGDEKLIEVESISREDILSILDKGGDKLLVEYWSKHQEGMLSLGQKIRIDEGMMFNVIDTSNISEQEMLRNLDERTTELIGESSDPDFTKCVIQAVTEARNKFELPSLGATQIIEFNIP